MNRTDRSLGPFSLESYIGRYGVSAAQGTVKVQAAFKKYLLHKIDLKKDNRLDPLLMEIKATLINSSSISRKRLNHLAYLVHMTTNAEREQLNEAVKISDLSECSKSMPVKIFAGGFHLIADPSVQWKLASQLQGHPYFQPHLKETLRTHPLNEPAQKIEKMESDLADLPNTSLLKQFLMERGALDREGKLLKEATPLETKQNIECCLELLTYMLKIDLNASDLKRSDKAVSIAVYDRFIEALDKNNKWKKQLSDILQDSDRGVAEKLEAIKAKLSGKEQVYNLQRALSLEITEKDLESAFASGPLANLGLGSFNSESCFFLEEWKKKQALESLYREDRTAIRSKVEDLSRSLGLVPSKKYTVCELYSYCLRNFKERISSLEDRPLLHLLLAKEAFLNHEPNMLALMVATLAPSDTSTPAAYVENGPSPAGSARTSNGSPASEDDLSFQEFIAGKGIEKREGTCEHKRLWNFAHDFHKNWDLYLSEIDVEKWPQQSKDECYKWLSNSSFVDFLGVELKVNDISNLESVLKSFVCKAVEEIRRLDLPLIYADMASVSLVSGNVKGLKLVADEIAYARYCEIRPSYTEPASFKQKTIAEKVEQTKNYLTKMKDKPQANYLLFCMESLPIAIAEVSEDQQSIIDVYLAGGCPNNSFYQYIEKGGFAPLSISEDKRLPYLFYIQRQFVKQMSEKAEKLPRDMGGAALACELKATGLLDLSRLDFVGQFIEGTLRIDMTSCRSLGLFTAMRKLFVDSVSESGFDAVINGFREIKELSEQKALLDDLKREGKDAVIKDIISCFWLTGYEWLKDQMKIVPEKDFMTFFVKYFRGIADPVISKMLASRSKLEDSLMQFQKAIKKVELSNSPIRSFLEKEGILEADGSLISYIDPEAVITRLNLALLTLRDVIRVNRELAQKPRSPIAFEGSVFWPQFLGDLNSDMKEASESGISIDCSAEVVKDMILRASRGPSENSFFSDYLKELNLESIKDLSPHKHYALYLRWVNRVILEFESKTKAAKSTGLWDLAKTCQEYIEQGAKTQDWALANTNATMILSIESLCHDNKTPEERDLARKVLQSIRQEGLLEEAAKQLGPTALSVREKWVQGLHAKIQPGVDWLNAALLKPLMEEVDIAKLSIPEKELRTESLMQALAKVLNQEFIRLGMGPSYYKDLIERALRDKDGHLWDFLYLEAAFANYHEVLRGLESEGKDVSDLKTGENKIQGEHLPEKIIQIVYMLRKDSYKAPYCSILLEAINTNRLLQLVRAEL